MEQVTEPEQLAVGTELRSPQRIMSLERMRWYCDALETAADADGTFKIAEPTIHTDEEYARSQGLPGIISDGMITTNWISGLLARTYGLGYVARGSLRTKFIRPCLQRRGDLDARARHRLRADPGRHGRLARGLVREGGRAAVHGRQRHCAARRGGGA